MSSLVVLQPTLRNQRCSSWRDTHRKNQNQTKTVAASLSSFVHYKKCVVGAVIFTKMSKEENVGVALALVVAAGASTGLGAAVVFFPSIVKLASRRVLAGSLGFSAGVMTYVSFVEIFVKSLGSFEDAGHEEKKAYLYATLCFFAGVIVMMVREFYFKKRIVLGK